LPGCSRWAREPSNTSNLFRQTTFFRDVGKSLSSLLFGVSNRHEVPGFETLRETRRVTVTLQQRRNLRDFWRQVKPLRRKTKISGSRVTTGGGVGGV
jgi:hypothetical protein